MRPKALDFSTVTVNTLGRDEPEISCEQFGLPCPEDSSIYHYLQTLPTCGSGKKFRETVKLLADIRRAGRPLLLGVGAGVLDDGLNPVLIDLIGRNLVSGLALTANAAYRDVEIAMTGGLSNTSGAGLEALFTSNEAAEVMNRGVNIGSVEGMGIGESLGVYLVGQGFAYNDKSLLVSARKKGIPVTVHVTIGAQTSHFLPTASGEAIGKTAHLDFRIFAEQVANLQGGVYINSGSRNTLPRVFMKALLAGRALGHQVDDFTTIFFGDHFSTDIETEWRSVIKGKHVSCSSVEGPFGLLYPLMIACLLDELSENC